MTYRGAIIGFGKVAVEAHLPAWQQSRDFALCAVVDSQPERLRLARRLVPGVAYYRSIEELFASEQLDCVDICTPPLLHDTILHEAAGQGIHILCEKPLTLSPAILAALNRCAIQNGRVVFTVHNWQYAPLFQALRETIRTNMVGRPEYLEFTTLRTNAVGARLESWRLNPRIAGGGILVDHGWHMFYLVHFLLGERPCAIATHLKRCRPPFDGVEDTATGTIEYANTWVRFHLTWTSTRRSTEGVIRGTEGTIHFDSASVWVERRGRRIYQQNFGETLTASSYHPAWFPPVLLAFQREIEDPQMCGENFRIAALCLAQIVKAYESHQRGGELLPLPDPIRTFWEEHSSEGHSPCSG